MLSMLKVDDIRVAYGAVEAVRGVSLHVGRGEIVALIGANGAGKSTFLAALAGVVKPLNGRIILDGESLGDLPAHRRASKGVCLVPEGGGTFHDLSVAENLQLGAYLVRDPRETATRREKVYRYFPILRERLRQPAGTLSGGERQMLALARALMMRPKLLMLDEPSLGLAPQIVRQVQELIIQINREEGTSILLVEQNSLMALAAAQRAYVMEVGRIALEGSSDTLARDPSIRDAYLGGAAR